MDRKHRIIGAAVTAALVATALSGATVAAQSAKEGGAVSPIALELAVAAFAGSGRVETFAAKVDELSGGQMRIDIDWDGGAEHVIPGRVQAGEADLGWLNARGLNAADVHALDALIAPFLVSDRRLLNEIITGPIGEDMLAGLADDGLEGLALLPGNQRFFVGIGRPLTALADFEGARLALARTPLIDRFVDALGAEAVSLGQDDPATYEAQEIDGVINNSSGSLFPDTYMTSNLVPYTVPLIVLANAEVMADLTPEQQGILRAAAVDMRDQLVAEMPVVESSAPRCAVGASVIEATDADIEAVVAATKPVRDRLAADPATAQFIERIETLKAELPAPTWPATCGAAPPADATLATIPDGMYRAVGTRQEALRAGWGECSELDEHIALVVANSGTEWSMLGACGDEPYWVGAAGTLEYSDSGDRVTQLEPGYPRGPTFAWSWDDGALTWTIVDPGEASDEDLKPARFLFERTFTMDQPDVAAAGIPDGTYKAQVTRDDALRIGFEDDCTLGGQVKTVTLVIESDQFTELQACGDGPSEVGSAGSLEYEGDRLIKREPGYPGQTTFEWSFEGDTLSLRVLQTDDELSVIRGLFEHEFERATS